MEEKLYSLLLALASVSFAALIRSTKESGWWLLGMAVGFACLRWRPDASVSQAALLLALCCVLMLGKAVQRPVALLISGGIVSVCHARLSDNLPFWFQLAAASSLLPLLLLILRHRKFRDAVMVDEALALVLAGALLLGLGPELMAGWRTAASLQSLDASVSVGTTQAAGPWTAGACVFLGILYTRRKYR